MTSIRPFEIRDRDQVRFICLESDGFCEKPESFRNYILYTYCDCYLDCEPESCFVAVNENNEVVGFIICTSNLSRYTSYFRKKYLPRLIRISPFRAVSSVLALRLQQKHCGDYPAHLHIALLPAYQRQGIGGSLTTTLIEHLRANGISGIMLTVGSDNKSGIAFYEKHGFKLIDRLPGEYAYGIKL